MAISGISGATDTPVAWYENNEPANATVLNRPIKSIANVVNQVISGFSGLSGSIVAGSFSGYSGKSGYSGTSGYSGKSGYSGAPGISGYSGHSTILLDTPITIYSGYIGYASGSPSGYSGVSGYSGYSGTWTDGFSSFSVFNSGDDLWTDYNTAVPDGATAVLLRVFAITNIETDGVPVPHAYLVMRLSPKSVSNPNNNPLNGVTTLSFPPIEDGINLAYGSRILNIGSDKEFKYTCFLLGTTIADVKGNTMRGNAEYSIFLDGWII